MLSVHWLAQSSSSSSSSGSSSSSSSSHFKLVLVLTFLLDKFNLIGCLVKSEYRYVFYLLY